MTKILIIHSSPNADGLTASCADYAVKGACQPGVEVEEIRLNDLNVGMCQACDNGWGTCLQDHTCQTQDDYQDLQARIVQADGFVLITPVYWGEMSESAKALTDRLRRCEATRGEESGLFQKPVLAVAAAGGSGNGMITCLGSMERWIEHVGARKVDFIAVNRWNKEYKLITIRSAAKLLVRIAQE